MDTDIKKMITNIRSRANGRNTGFVIGNTSRAPKNNAAYLIPIRETNQLIYGGIVVRSIAAAARVAKVIDGKVDYVFVDAEYKIDTTRRTARATGSIVRTVRRAVRTSKVLTYKGNDTTAEAVGMLVSELAPDISGMDIALIGCGNLGSKIALRLVERGAHVRVYRRDQKKLKKIVEGLNAMCLEHADSSLQISKSIRNACSGASVVIASANVRGIVEMKHLELAQNDRPPVLIDVGKGCFADEVIEKFPYSIYRLDVSTAQKHVFAACIETKSHCEKPLGRRVLDEGSITLVSTGILGRYGDVIVDDIKTPTQIIGVADGKGSLLIPVNTFMKTLKRLRALLNVP